MYIKSAGVCIRVSANEEVIESIRSSIFIFQYIPDVQLLDKCNEDKANLTIIDSSVHEFVFKNDRYVLKISEPEKRCRDIITIIEYILERLRQRIGIYCLHGSAISFGDKGVWLWGPISGLGKTSIAIGLCQEYGFKLIGDEKILINSNGHLIGGIKHISYNKKSLEKSISQNLNEKNETELSKVIKLETNKVKLSFAILPIASYLAEYIEKEKWDSNKSAFHFYEELSRKIRGVSRRIIDFTTPIESLDENKISVTRSLFANKIAESVPFCIISGNIGKIKTEISHMVM